VTATPFPRVFVPYDASDSAEAGLAFGLALGRAGSVLDVAYVIDETSIVAQSTATVAAFDPTPVLEAFESQSEALLEEVAARCREAGVSATTELVRELTVPGILTAVEEHGDALIVMGTHGRTGLQRVLLGSTTEGVLRGSHTPVLVLRPGMPPPTDGRLFRRLLVAVDRSDPSDAAAELGGALVRAFGSACIVCTVVDARELESQALTYGYDPQPAEAELRADAEAIVSRALARGGFPTGGAEPLVVDGSPGDTVVEVAATRQVDAIVMGSHGRRGLQRLLLGSVAEHVVHHSPVPVFVVRTRSEA
jgi:nucleotide-binding universal stress UspA family protein